VKSVKQTIRGAIERLLSTAQRVLGRRMQLWAWLSRTTGLLFLYLFPDTPQFLFILLVFKCTNFRRKRL